MFGMDQMMKEMLGIDPEELKAQFAQAAKQAQATVGAFDQYCKTILNNQQIINFKLERQNKMLEALLSHHNVAPPQAEVEPEVKPN